MPISCTPQALVDAAACYDCIPPANRKPVIIYLLALATGITPDAQALMNASKCYECIPPNFVEVVEAQLFNLALDGTGGRPLPPSNPAATDGSISDRIRIDWADVPGATSYEVYRSTTDDSTTATLIGTTATSSFDDTTATPGVTYYYWVKTVSPTGTSSFSTSTPGIILDPPTVTGPTDWNYFTLTWTDFAPGQRYIVSMLQQGAVRDYIQDLALGELTVEINNAFWNNAGVRIDHTTDWPQFWITAEDGSKASARVQPHWPLVTTPTLSVAGCGAPVLKTLGPLFKYYPTSNRNSPSIQSTNRYFEVFGRITYDMTGSLHTPATVTGDGGDVMKFTADGTSPTLATSNPAYDVPNGVGAGRLTGGVNAFFGAVKARACRNDGSLFVSPEITLVIDRWLPSIAQCDTWGIFGTYGEGPDTGLVAERTQPLCIRQDVWGLYHSLDQLQQYCIGKVLAFPPNSFLSRIYYSASKSGHTDNFTDVGSCPGNQVIQQYTASATVKSATEFQFSIPAGWNTIPDNVLSNAFFGEIHDSLPTTYDYEGVGVSGSGGSNVALQNAAYAFMHPITVDTLGTWTVCDVLFTLCYDNSQFGHF